MQNTHNKMSLSTHKSNKAYFTFENCTGADNTTKDIPP